MLKAGNKRGAGRMELKAATCIATCATPAPVEVAATPAPVEVAEGAQLIINAGTTINVPIGKKIIVKGSMCAGDTPVGRLRQGLGAQCVSSGPLLHQYPMVPEVVMTLAMVCLIPI